jgi:hypothetical protein
MPVVKEIAESIKLLCDVIKRTRQIIKAVNDGKEYLKQYQQEIGKKGQIFPFLTRNRPLNWSVVKWRLWAGH